jgi:hypothetical protein
VREAECEGIPPCTRACSCSAQTPGVGAGPERAAKRSRAPGPGGGTSGESMWAPARRGAARCGAARGRHGGAAAAPGAGGGGRHGEERGEREHPKDAGSRAGPSRNPPSPRWTAPRTLPRPGTRSAPRRPLLGAPRVAVALSGARLALRQGF